MVTGYVIDNYRGFLALGAAGVFLALSGAFGMQSTPLGARLAYWVPIMLAIGLGVPPFVALLPRAWLETGPRLAVWAAITAVVTPPILIFVWLITSVSFFQGPTLGRLLGLIGPVTLVAAVMSAIMMLVERAGRVTHAPPAAAAETAPPARFLARLPAKLMGGVLYAVESEDHYLRLHTSKGQDLILFRLADAVGELEGLEGAQTHRSWWVARDAVTGVRREGAKVTLLLKNGAEAPVSRPNLKPLKDAGWF